ncbi:hypothetical protein MTP03_36380 [Tsukamurella sp. PLM1]|nr:hypothetical protein MTP03_36380 [Tsukamurella sp. PLM1]
MGRLVAIEGLDGAGKNTLTRAVTSQLRSAGRTVTALAFPRYGTQFADLAAEALRGDNGDVAESVYGMALLFAFDRQAAAPDVRAALRTHDVVLLDRYAASSAAYSAARLHEGPDGAVAAWVRALEFERFGLPAPDLQVYLDVPVSLAAERAAPARPPTRAASATPTRPTPTCRPAPARSTPVWPRTHGSRPGTYTGRTTIRACSPTRSQRFPEIHACYSLKSHPHRC